MNHNIFEGSAVAAVTPMSGYGNLDFDALGRLPEWTMREGTNVVVVNSTTRGSIALDDKERMAVIRYAVRQVDGRIPMIAGMGSNRTEHVVKLSRKTQELGTDVLLQMTPYYNKASQEELVRHSTQMADHIDMLILSYDVPSRTGVTIRPGTYRVLSEYPSIQGTKGANGNLSLIVGTAALYGQGFSIYSSDDDQTVPIMSLGGKGVVSALTSIMPKETHKMRHLHLDEDVKENRWMQLQLLEIVEALFWGINLISVKTALGLMGTCGDDLRLPLTPVEPKQREGLAEVMERQGISLKKESHNRADLL